MAKRGRMVGAAIVLVGAILLIAALFTPWYMEQFSNSGNTETMYAYPGIPTSSGTIQYTCSGISSCPGSTSYSAHNLTNSGNIAEAGYFLIIGGLVLGLIGAILGFTSGNNPRRARPAMTLALVGGILAIAAVGAFVAALPSAIGSDTPGHTGTGPWSSFFGSTSLGGGTLTWGPGIGWYLGIVAFVVLLVGMIVLARARKDPSVPAAAAPAVPPNP
jgi:hypothetical protein